MTEDQKHNQPSLVVVGNGMASHALLRGLSQNDVIDSFQVTVIGEEPRPAYDRVNLTDFFSGKTPDDLLLSSGQWYRDNGIDLVTGERVTRIDRANRQIVTDSERRIEYNHLVLATGSRPFVPPIEGVDHEGIFLYRTVEDLEAIRSYAKNCRSAAVLGGGLLGLEAAKALLDLGLQPHVIEMAPVLMPRQLASDAAGMLCERIEALGVEVRLACRTERITRDDSSLLLQFDNDETLQVDMVIVSAGIRPRDELARDAELPTGQRGGIVVNDQMRTEDPRVFAIGECASLNNQLFGLVAPCYQMAAVVSDNLASLASGQAMEARFASEGGASRLKLMGVDVATVGQTIGESPDVLVVTHRGEDSCVSLLLRDRQLLGALGVGRWPDRDRLSDVIDAHGRLTARQVRRFRDTGQVWGTARTRVQDWPESATVCSCLSIKRGELSAAINAGASDYDSLAEATGASTVCGSCRELLCELTETPEPARRSRIGKLLLAASMLTIALIPAYLLAGPVPVGDSVHSVWHKTNQVLRHDVIKQSTGYALLGISLVGLLLSLRKRWQRFQWGKFSAWRSLHAVLGTATIIGFCMHTGLHLGENLTLALALVFLSLNFLGAVTGITAALEPALSGDSARHMRQWRPRLTKWHIFAFWPLPVLVVFHVVSIYFY